MRLTPRQRASWLAHLFKAATQQHHRDLEPLLRPLVPADGVVLDVGAHAGQFAKLFARLAPRGQVWAFEPSAYARSILVPALALNGLSRRVHVVPAGLSDAPGELVLHTPLKRTGALGFGTAHLGEGGEALGVHDQAVRLLTLDAFAAERGLDRLDVIKIDIEGWELRALMGGAATLARFRPAILLEADAAMLARAGDDPAALFGFLEGLGYRPFSVPDRRPLDGYSDADDYLFLAA
ncbi:MAG TPA: FkbM family methyltransferase [Caulobacteraceae bacterium]|nr:FkbM family methyltransferase [Caulobacteraceae bacterium]